MRKKFLLLSMSLLLVLSLASGCETYKWKDEAGNLYTDDEVLLMSPEDKVGLEPTYKVKIGEKALTTIDKAGVMTERSIPIVAGLADLFFPGAGVLLTGIVGTTLGLYKRWRAPLAEAHDGWSATSTGARALADAVDELKVTAPEAWAALKGLINKRKKKLIDKDEEFEWPNEV